MENNIDTVNDMKKFLNAFDEIENETYEDKPSNENTGESNPDNANGINDMKKYMQAVDESVEITELPNNESHFAIFFDEMHGKYAVGGAGSEVECETYVRWMSNSYKRKMYVKPRIVTREKFIEMINKGELSVHDTDHYKKTLGLTEGADYSELDDDEMAKIEQNHIDKNKRALTAEELNILRVMDSLSSKGGCTNIASMVEYYADETDEDRDDIIGRIYELMKSLVSRSIVNKTTDGKSKNKATVAYCVNDAYLHMVRMQNESQDNGNKVGLNHEAY